jgi:hypothetical protein
MSKRTAAFVGLFALCGIAPAVLCATQSSSAAAMGLSSSKERGVVSIVSEPALSDGRLVIKIVAFNRRTEPAGFGPANVQISTAAGKPVALVPLAQLIREMQKAAGANTRQASNTDHNPSDYSHRGIPTSGVGGGGEPDVSGYSGADNPTSGVVSSHTRATSGARAMSDAQLEANIAALNAGILQPMTVAPATAAGGQVVTEKLKFSRKDPRALHLVVTFNDEPHDFDFEVPR